MRPIDISRRFGISTTTIREYELLGLMPPVPRSPAGYRAFTEEHAAYIACVREMLPAFHLIEIAKVFEAVMLRETDTALWIVNKKQADLYHEKLIAEKIAKSLLPGRGHPTPVKEGRLTIHDISRETGVPATTIRHWDKTGLISVKRSAGNGYRIFGTEHIKQILTIYALKLFVYANHQKYSIEQIRESMHSFDYTDKSKISAMTAAIGQHLSKMNRDQMKAASALFHLCLQVEAGKFDEMR